MSFIAMLAKIVLAHVVFNNMLVCMSSLSKCCVCNFVLADVVFAVFVSPNVALATFVFFFYNSYFAIVVSTIVVFAIFVLANLRFSELFVSKGCACNCRVRKCCACIFVC